MFDMAVNQMENLSFQFINEVDQFTVKTDNSCRKRFWSVKKAPYLKTEGLRFGAANFRMKLY